MSERVCVCGHPESSHGVERETGTVEFETHRPHTAFMCECGCDEFRPVLPWPDAEGWWYMQSEEFESMSYARLMDGELVAAVALYETYRDECGREEFTKKHGPAKFTKCEPNPFTKG